MSIYAKFVPFDGSGGWVDLKGKAEVDFSEVLTAAQDWAESNPWEMADNYLEKDDLDFEVDEIYQGKVLFRVSGTAQFPLNDLLEEITLEAEGWELDEYSLDFTSTQWEDDGGGTLTREVKIKGRRLSG